LKASYQQQDKYQVWKVVVMFLEQMEFKMQQKLNVLQRQLMVKMEIEVTQV
jgi:hypothetical protein